MKLTVGRAKDDPEKAVLPALVYASEREGRVSVHMLALGWWDWSVSIRWHRKEQRL